MSWPWSQLGLPGPAGLSQVRRAYAEKLKTTHPEDDPEGFQRLHAAYQLASRMARQRRREGAVSLPLEPEEEQNFDYDALLQEGGERPRRARAERDFDFDRLLAEGEAERAEERRRDEERRQRAARAKRKKERLWRSLASLPALALLCAAVLLLPGALDIIRDRMPEADPREEVCRYLEEDYGVPVRSLYNRDSPDERFGNVFALEGQEVRMFLAGPDGDRDKENGKLGYTTNYPNMMVLWALKDFAGEQGLRELDLMDRGLGSWDTSGVYLIVLPFYGAGEVITALGERLEALAREDWYQFSPPDFKLVLCGSQMAAGRLILQEYQSGEGPFDAEGVRRLYEESFAHSYCAQLLKECGLDRDFVHDGAEAYTLTGGGMAELKGELCCKLYGLDGENTVRMEYYVNEESSSVYCVPGDFWESGGEEDDIRFYRLVHREEPGGMFRLYYPWVTVY